MITKYLVERANATSSSFMILREGLAQVLVTIHFFIKWAANVHASVI